jgi:hypothetical protein
MFPDEETLHLFHKMTNEMPNSNPHSLSYEKQESNMMDTFFLPHYTVKALLLHIVTLKLMLTKFPIIMQCKTSR